jgi:Cu/Ag efflux pump CusA
LALIGGVFAVALTGGVLTIASIVGFIALFGITVRNGLILVTHYEHLMDIEKKPFEEVVVQGSLDRLAPVLMTALAAGLGLLPMAWGGGAGKELNQPLAIVLLGGLFTSTFLNLVVVPTLFQKFGRPRMQSHLLTA